MTMHIAKGLSIREGACFACVAQLDPRASDQEERVTSSLIDRCLDHGKKYILKQVKNDIQLNLLTVIVARLNASTSVKDVRAMDTPLRRIVREIPSSKVPPCFSRFTWRNVCTMTNMSSMPIPVASKQLNLEGPSPNLIYLK